MALPSTLQSVSQCRLFLSLSVLAATVCGCAREGGAGEEAGVVHQVQAALQAAVGPRTQGAGPHQTGEVKCRLRTFSFYTTAVLILRLGTLGRLDRLFFFFFFPFGGR